MEIAFNQGRQINEAVFQLQGDLDLYASVSFFRIVSERFNKDTNHLILDFTNVRYMDSSGVGALIRLAQYSKSIAGDIQLANLGGTPRKVLEMSNIIKLFKIVDDVETALKAWE